VKRDPPPERRLTWKLLYFSIQPDVSISTIVCVACVVIMNLTYWLPPRGDLKRSGSRQSSFWSIVVQLLVDIKLSTCSKVVKPIFGCVGDAAD
jgi:hypothetical protein